MLGRCLILQDVALGVREFLCSELDTAVQRADKAWALYYAKIGRLYPSLPEEPAWQRTEEVASQCITTLVAWEVASYGGPIIPRKPLWAGEELLERPTCIPESQRVAWVARLSWIRLEETD